jgi:hypothetical protein
MTKFYLRLRLDFNKTGTKTDLTYWNNVVKGWVYEVKIINKKTKEKVIGAIVNFKVNTIDGKVFLTSLEHDWNSPIPHPWEEYQVIWGVKHGNLIVKKEIEGQFFSSKFKDGTDWTIHPIKESVAQAVPKSQDPVTKVVIPKKKAIVFFIGGAGDKKMYAGSGPNYNIVGAQYGFNAEKEQKLSAIQKNIESGPPYLSLEIALKLRECSENQNKTEEQMIKALPNPVYLGYYEIYKDSDIQKNIIDKIGKNTLVYIVGHSLGGWNGAHLTERLFEMTGIITTMLITLDPVGTRLGVKGFSDIFPNRPVIFAQQWVNVRCDAKFGVYDGSDVVADLGGQWQPEDDGLKPSTNAVVNEVHGAAWKIFKNPIKNGLSARDLLIASLKEKVK